jgi:hypothetical protein
MSTTDTTTTAKSVRVEVDFSGHPVRTNAELDAAMASLRAELDELRKDKARLDWLTKNPTRTDMDFGNGPRGVAWSLAVDSSAPSLRAVIDSLMAKHP